LTFGIFLIGQNILHLPLSQLQTLSFITLVFTAQGTIYLVRERHHFWASLPGKWLMLASALDVIMVIILASAGILMQAIPLWLILGNLAFVTAVLFSLDFIKVWVFQKYNLR
jgi:H+-transporting ATPase